MTLKEKMKISFNIAMAERYFRLGVMAKNNGLRVRDCPFKNVFKNVHWVRGYYSVK